jgi:hypothetical protein
MHHATRQVKAHFVLRLDHAHARDIRDLLDRIQRVKHSNHRTQIQSSVV